MGSITLVNIEVNSENLNCVSGWVFCFVFFLLFLIGFTFRLTEWDFFPLSEESYFSN